MTSLNSSITFIS